MNEFIQANRVHWDEATGVHVASEFYDVEAFRAGASRLHGIERAELGDVAGKSLLHLQCHFGLDTLSWARLGARVTGIDFSEAAIAQARALATALDIPARFIVSDLYDAPAALDEQFDIVFTSYGAIYWLPDIHRWGEVAAGFVKPGGTFYIAEFHPTGFLFDTDHGTDPTMTDYVRKYPYFHSEQPIRDESSDYADPSAAMEHTVTYSWAHSMGDILNALIDGGLVIEYLHEFPFSTVRQFSFLEQHDDGYWYPPDGKYDMPMLFSIKARKS
ncbi:MAG: class I SAM-dependent methyltransferase [Actinomycetota bacterium]